MSTNNIKTLIKEISSCPRSRLVHYFNTKCLKTLCDVKCFADDIYYNSGKESGLSDFCYDKMKDFIEQKTRAFSQVGSVVRKGSNRVKLPYWLGSMTKKTKPAQINHWALNNPHQRYIAEHKLDGVCGLYVNDGNGRAKLFTRGNGAHGADISYLLPYLSSIPSIKDDINIRGEFIIRKDTFERVYANTYSNARNMVSGIICAASIREGLKDVQFIAYELIPKDGLHQQLCPSDQLAYLNKIGFMTVNYVIINNINIDRLRTRLTHSKNESPHTIDGLIIQPDKSYTRNTASNPKYAFAFKMYFEQNSIEAEVTHVEWNESKWRRLKPKIKLKPVNLNGVTISSTTGFHGKYIRDNCIGPGSVVLITRSGDVIPHIHTIVKKAKTPDMPSVPYKWADSGIDIVSLSDHSDKSVKLKHIHSFFAALNIKYLGESSVKKLYEHGFDTIIKIISASESELNSIDTFGVKSANRIYKNIRKGLINVSMADLLSAAGIFGFGIGTVRVRHLMEWWPDIFTQYKKMNEQEIINRIVGMEGFSSSLARNITINIKKADNFAETVKPFVVVKNNKNKGGDLFKNLKIVFSGFRDSELKNRILLNGGKIMSSVTSNTSIVVVKDDKYKSSGKAKKAERLNTEKNTRIQVLTKVEFDSVFHNNTRAP